MISLFKSSLFKSSACDLSTIVARDFRNLIAEPFARYDDAGPVCSRLTIRDLP